MAIGDLLFNSCPQCKADNRFVNTVDDPSEQDLWWLECSKCGLAGEIAGTRKEAIDLWNKLMPLN